MSQKDSDTLLKNFKAHRKNHKTQDAVELLITFGFDKTGSTNSTTIWQHSEFKEIKLQLTKEAELRPYDTGKIVQACEQVIKLSKKSTTELEEIKEIIRRDHVHEFGMPLVTKASHSKSAKQLLRAHAEQMLDHTLPDYLNLKTGLQQDHDIKFEIDKKNHTLTLIEPENSILLTRIDYTHLTGAEVKTHVQNYKTQLEGILNKRDNKLQEYLSLGGTKIDEDDSSITIQALDGKTVKIELFSSLGYPTKAGEEKLDQLISEAKKPAIIIAPKAELPPVQLTHVQRLSQPSKPKVPAKTLFFESASRRQVVIQDGRAKPQTIAAKKKLLDIIEIATFINDKTEMFDFAADKMGVRVELLKNYIDPEDKSAPRELNKPQLTMFKAKFMKFLSAQMDAATDADSPEKRKLMKKAETNFDIVATNGMDKIPAKNSR